MIVTGGRAEDGSRARVRCAWANFRELATILTSKRASFNVKGKVYKACVWPAQVDDMQRLEKKWNE